MAERSILEAQGKTKGEGEEVTPKTDLLCKRVILDGWHYDAAPVDYIMASHESMEKELAELKAGFDAERDSVERMTRGHNACLKGMEMLAKMLSDERALADEMAGQLKHASLTYDPGGCRKMFEAWKAARAK